MREVRTSMVMHDHLRLVEKVNQIHISSLHESCLEEACLVKKAVEFYLNIEKVKENVRLSCVSGHPGQVHIQGSSGSLLEKTLSIHNPDLCPHLSRTFLTRARTLVSLRESVKADNWDIANAAQVLMSYHSSAGHDARKVMSTDVAREIFSYKQQTTDDDGCGTGYGDGNSHGDEYGISDGSGDGEPETGHGALVVSHRLHLTAIESILHDLQSAPKKKGIPPPDSMGGKGDKGAQGGDSDAQYVDKSHLVYYISR